MDSLPPPIVIRDINEQNIDETLQRLRKLNQDDNKKYRVYGIWSCQSRQCSNEWESLYTQKSFKVYLDKTEFHSFKRKCWMCNSKCQFSSIQLYEQQQMSKESNVIQIVRQLVNSTVYSKYLVYGHWICRNWKCGHKPQCRNKSECQDKWQYQNKWKCPHNRRCHKVEQCRKKMCNCRCRYYLSNHERHCQNKWTKLNEWKCNHESKCRNEWECQWECKCQNEWLKKYTLEELEKYRSSEKNFRQLCKECNQWSQVSSFHLYTQQPKNKNEIPAIEIICHLGWNNHYRVYGDWNCCGCDVSWPSAFTWISLQKFMDEIPGESLNRGDFYTQKCKKCENPENKILEYAPLKKAEGKKPHTRGVCIKCLYYDSCRQTGTYLGLTS
ncbi:unnamed protein product [Rhizophagus irregularis]|uniref:3CxxC-type domain-containing protein n=1 Tax=Rhizophagus irregularis TaxID=588596 RepID=A0A2N1MVY9_9GLOM|nr:hypothetical protein RhiirC2_754586 [Rhizophagus irregularis]CAB4399912.1 unnamed protein product [Rhizophagus irregularis]CAB5392885.1 unnamed protein product [Rhizophagus irregularis]